MNEKYQQAVALQDESIRNELSKRYLGTARIDISHLQADDGDDFRKQQFCVVVDELNIERRVKRLLRIFALNGIRRLVPEHQVKALISREELNDALRLLNLSLDNLSEDSPPKLKLLPSKQLRCLDGRHRLLAAQRVLKGNDAWWAVKLYSSESSAELQDYLREDYSNAANFYDGEILRHIRLYQEKKDRINELKWWAYLTSGKATSLKRELKKPGFEEVYDNLMLITGLWPQFLIGSMRRDYILKCDELRLNYLRRIYSVWYKITGGNKEIMMLTDPYTVQKLQLKAPSASLEDAAFVNRGMASKELFSFVTDLTICENIRRNILRIKGLIPTLWSYREDTKYLEPLVNAMKILVEVGDRETLCQAFRRIYIRDTCERGTYLRQDGEHDFVRASCDDADRFRLHFGQLALCCARDFQWMVNVAARKDVDKDKPIIREPSVKVINRVANLAYNFGFDSPQIQKLKSGDPTSQEVFNCLVRLESDEDDIDENSLRALAHKIIRVRRAHNIQRKRITAQQPHLTSNKVELSLAERCGRTFDSAQKDDRKFLFLRWMTDSHAQGRYITSFFVKRAILTSFFSGDYSFERPEPSNSAAGTEGLGDPKSTGKVGPSTQDGQSQQLVIPSMQLALGGQLEPISQEDVSMANLPAVVSHIEMLRYLTTDNNIGRGN